MSQLLATCSIAALASGSYRVAASKRNSAARVRQYSGSSLSAANGLIFAEEEKPRRQCGSSSAGQVSTPSHARGGHATNDACSAQFQRMITYVSVQRKVVRTETLS